jgi:retinol dehydrogenase-12
MGAVNFAAFRDGAPRRRMAPMDLYQQSKIGNVLLSNELARRYARDGVVSVALNPGNLDSELQRHLTGVRAFVVVRPPMLSCMPLLSAAQSKVVHPAQFGALTQLWAGTSAAGLQMNGKYLWPWAREGKMPKPAQDVRVQEEVWAWCEKQVEGI